MTRTLLSAIAVCLILAGCSGGAAQVAAPQNNPPAGGNGSPGARLLRNASGAPFGVRVSWEAVPDAAGYNLYRMDTAIPDSELGQPGHRVNASPIPAVPGTNSFDDIFPVSIGEVWHYRVSAVDDTGDEGDMSPESALTITDFNVTQLLQTTGGVGDEVEIIGENFGEFDPTGDKVFFVGVIFDPNDGFMPGLVEATVTDWQRSSIKVNVPSGATTGKVAVQSNGLSQDTPETFTNTDPYIESISPIHGNIDDVVTVTGRNFGIGPSASNKLVFGGNDLPGGNYASYTDTEVQFHATIDEGFNQQVDVAVRVGLKLSNSGGFSVDSRAPQAALTTTPIGGGSTPLLVDLDASASVEPDGDFMIFNWDFDGDGTIDFDSGFDPTVSHTYDIPGSYEATVYVFDSIPSSSTASQTLDVDLSPVVLEDNGTFAPGSEFFQTDNFITINYKLSGGQPVYKMDWYLIDPNNEGIYLLANDTDVPYGAGSRQFAIDTSAKPMDGAGVIPAGTWSIWADAHDGSTDNDPDPSFDWPRFANGTPGTFNVYRYRVLLVVDTEGDKTSNESVNVQRTLSKLGYKTGFRSSTNLQVSDLAGADAVIWASDGGYGIPGSPYIGWLSTADFNVMKQYLDAHGNLILLGPPQFGGTDLADGVFKDFYQPFAFFQDQSAVPRDVNLRGYAAANDYTLQSCTLAGTYGDDSGNNLIGGTSQGEYMNAVGTLSHVMGARTSPGGGTLFFGMFRFSTVASVMPAGSTPDMLLDNIVVGTIKN